MIAAVHHASDALHQLAEVHHKQAWLGVRAGRFLVPTRSLPASCDIPRPYGPAPPDRTSIVLSAYQYTRTASSDAAASIADVAAATRAPSRVLTRASAAAADSRGEVPAATMRERSADVAVWEPPDLPGPVAAGTVRYWSNEPPGGRRIRRAPPDPFHFCLLQTV